MVAVNYDWDEVEDNIDEEYDDARGTVAAYSIEPRRFGSVISQQRSGHGSFFHFDSLGSTLALTDNIGAITDAYSYTAFGTLSSHSGITETPFRYSGRAGSFLDVELGDISVRGQLFSPPHGRWLTSKPPSFPSDRNQYTYPLDTRSPAIQHTLNQPFPSDRTIGPPAKTRPYVPKGDLLGTFNVSLQPCLLEYAESCCCTKVDVSYKPTLLDQLSFDLIYLRVAVQTSTSYYKCSLGIPFLYPPFKIVPWHIDCPKDAQQAWKSSPGGSVTRPRWTDFPGHGFKKNQIFPGLCPPVCSPRVLIQEFEVCAWGVNRIPVSAGIGAWSYSLLGCVAYSHTCQFTYTDLARGLLGCSLCVATCKTVRTGGGADIAGYSPPRVQSTPSPLLPPAYKPGAGECVGSNHPIFEYPPP